MYLFRDNTVIQEWVISTSKNKPSNLENSLGTPLGLHEVREKIGADQPIGMVFKGRVPQEYCYQEKSKEILPENLITSRIFRLYGLEEGVNQGGKADSWSRYIYIHGTNHEAKLGTPISSGCILMKNTEIIELFEKMQLGTYLWIDLD